MLQEGPSLSPEYKIKKKQVIHKPDPIVYATGSQKNDSNMPELQYQLNKYLILHLKNGLLSFTLHSTGESGLNRHTLNRLVVSRFEIFSLWPRLCIGHKLKIEKRSTTELYRLARVLRTNPQINPLLWTEFDLVFTVWDERCSLGRV